MSFWFYMLAMNLLVPLCMVGFGWKFSHNPPENINKRFGYRSSMSMLNRDTWAFAHRFCGRLWFWLGLLLLLCSGLFMFFMLGADEQSLGRASAILCLCQLIPMAAVIIPTEIALRRTFHPSGRRKKSVKGRLQ